LSVRIARVAAPALALVAVGVAAARAQGVASAAPAVQVSRLAANPLVTVSSSPTLGTNVNGPTVVRVPEWVERPLGRYYMYFANHMGAFVRLAYADRVEGPWTIHAPGVLQASETAFFRPQPDPPETVEDFYTHVASPEIVVDAARKRLLMWVHGWWTAGERWPADPKAAAWAREKGYGQFTQLAESADGVRFEVRAPITKISYLRVFDHAGQWYGMARLGRLARSKDPRTTFELGPNPFRGGRYAKRIRHVGLLRRGNRLHVFFTAIGDAPERVLMSAIDLAGDWTTWRASAPVEVLRPETPYECRDLADAPSLAGDVEERVKQIRDPFVFEENGRTYLFYSICGEQGIAAATIVVP
jgi:hypothetical protein